MARVSKFWAQFFAASVAATAAVAACAASPGPIVEFDADAMARLVERERERHAIPAMAVALVDGDRVVWTAGFGDVDLERSAAVTSRTPFRIGSVGKVINALAIARAADWDPGVFDRTITEFDPRFDLDGPPGRAITIRDLLSHSAGVVRETPVGHYLSPDDPGLDATIASIEHTCRVYVPGEKIKYSNAGVTLSGRALKVLAGEPYRDAVQDLVFGPLGMQDSGFGVDARMPAALQRSRAGADAPAARFNIGMVPAGDMHASADDVAKLIVEVFRGLDQDGDAEFDADTLQLMMKPFQDPDADNWHMEVGLGFVLNGKFDGAKMARHGGGVYGFSTEFALLPEERLGVVVMSAREGSLGVAQGLGHHMLRLLLAERRGDPVPSFEPSASLYEDTEAALAAMRETASDAVPAAWRDFLGFYGWPHGGVEILSDGDTLFASVEGGAPAALAAEDARTFKFGRFDDLGDEWLRFIEVDGRVAGLALGAGTGFTLHKEGVDADIPATYEMPCESD